MNSPSMGCFPNLHNTNICGEVSNQRQFQDTAIMIRWIVPNMFFGNSCVAELQNASLALAIIPLFPIKSFSMWSNHASQNLRPCVHSTGRLSCKGDCSNVYNIWCSCAHIMNAQPRLLRLYNKEWYCLFSVRCMATVLPQSFHLMYLCCTENT